MRIRDNTEGSFIVAVLVLVLAVIGAAWVLSMILVTVIYMLARAANRKLTRERIKWITHTRHGK